MLSHSRRQGQADNLTRGKEAETKQKKEGYEGADTTAINDVERKAAAIKEKEERLEIWIL